MGNFVIIGQLPLLSERDSRPNTLGPCKGQTPDSIHGPAKILKGALVTGQGTRDTTVFL